VHLTGETYAGDFFGAKVGTRERLANREAGGAPPVFGVLLGPADLRRSEGLMLFRCGRNDVAVAVNDDGARTSSTNVNPEYVDRASSTTSRWNYCGHHIETWGVGKG
jgi:hypothetical protein